MAKSNQKLTTELERLQVIVGQNANLLNQFMPELRTSLKELDDRQVASAAKTKDIDDKLKTSQPVGECGSHIQTNQNGLQSRGGV